MRHATYPEMPEGTPNTGAMLRRCFDEHRMHQSALGRLMNRTQATTAEYTKRPSIQTAILWELSIILKHNFFADIAAVLPADFSTNVPVDGSKDAEIARLEDELRVARAERELLREILAGRGRAGNAGNV